jgi:FkbM family methyltransferase
MSTVSTIFQIANHAKQGKTIKDKWLAFLIAGLGVIGHHRFKTRQWFIKQIDRLSQKDSVQIKLWIDKKLSYFSMRKGNEADYLIGGELVRGGYEIPPFEPQTIVDGGSNIGMFAIEALSYFPNAKITCYEPDSINFQQLQKNLAQNNLEAKVLQLGLWSKETTLYYHSQSSHTGFVDENPPGVAIPCTVPEIGSDCWLKLDIEGGEYEVLPALFRKGSYPRWISLEIHYFDTKGQSIISLLKEHGYQIKGDINPTVDCIVISAYRSSNLL